MNVKVANYALDKAPKKYVRLILTEDSKDYHRLVETSTGQLEYRLGIGKWSQLKPRQFVTLIRNVVQTAKSHQIENLALEISGSQFSKLAPLGDSWVISTLVENLLIANYSFLTYKTNSKPKKEIKEILICGDLTKAEKEAFDRGRTVGTYVNHARDVANTPGDDMTPSELALKAKKLAQGTKIKVTVLGASDIKKQGLHALIAVGKGADNPPKFIIMEYYGLKKPTSSNKKDSSLQPIILVGKGITYDTGGLNVKPSGAMHEMHMDMSGGGAVISSIVCAAKLKLAKNIIAIIPAAENAISAKAMRAGDIINSHSGKTIEVLHTDAEGRLVLADGLSFAKKFNPRVVLDVATLTGAALAAVGQQASVILTENENLQKKLQEYGEISGDYTWPLPLWDEYKTPLTQTRADVVNIHPQFSRFGGCIEGAAFLSFFAPQCPWAHLDIAPRMTAIPTDKLAKGATGEPVRLLMTFLENY